MQFAALRHEARAAMGRGDLPAASRLCQQILEQQRGDREALLLLSQMAFTVGQHEPALDYVKQAIRAEPKDASLYLRLGQMYGQLARYPKAHDALDKALKLAPGYASAVAAKGMVYERQDKYAKARTLLKPHARPQDRLDPEIAAVLLRVLLHDDSADEAVTLARRLLESAPRNAAPGGAERNAYFAAVKAFEAAGDYDMAFDVASRANAIDTAPFDPDAFRRSIDEIIDVFSRERIASLPRPATDSDLPVFIVGMPRCGSTLTERIIDAHPDAFGADETPVFHTLVDDLPCDLGSTRPYPSCVVDLTPEASERNSVLYLERLRALHPKAKRISNKDLGVWRHLGLVNTLFPAGRVIHCRRDPVDNCLSCFTERLKPSSCPYSTDLTNLGLAYREYERLMEHWRTVLDIELIEIAYEDLIADQDGTTRAILEFLDLPWHEGCLRFHESKRMDKTLSYDQVRRPLYGSSVGRAERYGRRLDPLRAALAGS